MAKKITPKYEGLVLDAEMIFSTWFDSIMKKGMTESFNKASILTKGSWIRLTSEAQITLSIR